MGLPEISGQTNLVGVVGSPVRHSASPLMHNAAFDALGLDWRYFAFEVLPTAGPGIVEAMRTLQLRGLNITMPHKDSVANSADRLTPTAVALQTCNTLYWDNDEIVGHSTDGDGYVNAFKSQSDLALAGASIAVLGTGGAARSIVEALGRNQVRHIVVAGRDNSKAETAAALAPQAEACTFNDHDVIARSDLIINATSVGMIGGADPGGIPLPKRIINHNHTVSDIVYHPRETPLLAAAAGQGAHVVGGIGMLAHQAALSFSLWTGEIAPIEVMIAQIERPL